MLVQRVRSVRYVQYGGLRGYVATPSCVWTQDSSNVSNDNASVDRRWYVGLGDGSVPTPSLSSDFRLGHGHTFCVRDSPFAFHRVTDGNGCIHMFLQNTLLIHIPQAVHVADAYLRGSSGASREIQSCRARASSLPFFHVPPASLCPTMNSVHTGLTMRLPPSQTLHDTSVSRVHITLHLGLRLLFSIKDNRDGTVVVDPQSPIQTQFNILQLLRDLPQTPSVLTLQGRLNGFMELATYVVKVMETIHRNVPPHVSRQLGFGVRQYDQSLRELELDIREYRLHLANATPPGISRYIFLHIFATYRWDTLCRHAEDSIRAQQEVIENVLLLLMK